MGKGTGRRNVLIFGPLLTVVSFVALAVVVTVFVDSPAGQRIDETALTGARIGQSRILESALSVLHLVSELGLAAVTIGIAVVAMSQRRVAVAAAAVAVVGGANLTTQILKQLVERPDLGIDTHTVNSLPSGHTTVAVSLAAALVLVAPARLRGLCSVVGVGGATLMGVAALAAGWHRPSDVVAAALVVGAWAGLVATVLVGTARPRTAQPLRGRAEPDSRAPGDDRLSIAVLTSVGLALVSAAAVALWRTSLLSAIPTDRSDLFVAYVGGVAGIGAAVSLVLAAVSVVAGMSAGAISSPDVPPATGSSVSGTLAATRSDNSVRAIGPGAYADGTSTRTQATRPGV